MYVKFQCGIFGVLINQLNFYFMTIQVKLTESEVKGIKAYLASFDDDTSKAAIQQYIRGIVDCTIHAPQEAVSEYIKNETK